MSQSRKHKVQDDSDASPPRISRKSFNEASSKNDTLSKSHSSSKNSQHRDSRIIEKRNSTHSPSRPSQKDTGRKSRWEEMSSVNKSIERHITLKDHRSQNSYHRSSDSDSDDSHMRKSTKSKKLPERSSRLHEKEYNSRKMFDRKNDSGESPPRKKEKSDTGINESKRKVERTLDGRKAGLQDAKELRREIIEFKNKENEIFEKMDPSVSGVGAAPIVRDSRTGKRRNLEHEAKEKQEEDKKTAEQKAKYTRWGKGLKQVEDSEERLKQDLYEMSKPLARYANDEDLDKHLKEQEREGDPMLEYIRSKAHDCSVKGKPQYKGSFFPNRFGIRPGHRWDGVDRSSGYEEKWFGQVNAKRALEEEAYKWSTSDM